MTKFKGSSLLRFSVLLFIVYTLVIQNGWTSEQADAPPGFSTGQELITRGSYPEALALFREISHSSDNPQVRAGALFHMGSIYDNYLNLPENAVECYRDLILMYPESPAAPDDLFNTGRIYYKNERYKEALKSFDDYMERYPAGARLAAVKSWAESAALKCRENTPQGLKRNGLSTLDPFIRVLLSKKADRFQINSPAYLSVRSMEKGDVIFDGKGPLTFTRRGKQLVLNGKALTAESCRIMHQGEWISLGGRKYRGFLSVHLRPSGLMAVNHLDVESYLYGVVPKEMSPLWAPQALAAQAIASRTFALYIREKHASGDKAYDLEATTSSQVYGGFDVEKETARAAVDASRGLVLAYENKLIISYFHANSGGHTESSLNVWGVDLPYLKSVEDRYSVEPPEQTWQYFLSYKDIGKIFSRFLAGNGLKRIEPQEKSPSGRVLHFLLCSDDKQVKVPGNSFRLKVGPVNMKSTICDVTPEKNGVKFSGTGYGHGVGMSQLGAQRMALAGFSSEDILKHYYKDVDILKISYL